MDYVLQLVREDKKLAKLLARALVNAKNENDVSEAFADTYVMYMEKMNTTEDGTVDEEAVLRAQVEAAVKSAVFNAEFAISTLKEELDIAS